MMDCPDTLLHTSIRPARQMPLMSKFYPNALKHKGEYTNISMKLGLCFYASVKYV